MSIALGSRVKSGGGTGGGLGGLAAFAAFAGFFAGCDCWALAPVATRRTLSTIRIQRFIMAFSSSPVAMDLKSISKICRDVTTTERIDLDCLVLSDTTLLKSTKL
jgi:hypothetical protein